MSLCPKTMQECDKNPLLCNTTCYLTQPKHEFYITIDHAGKPFQWTTELVKECIYFCHNINKTRTTLPKYWGKDLVDEFIKEKISQSVPTPIITQMQDIIRIVHEDFPQPLPNTVPQDDGQPCSSCGNNMVEIQKHTYNQSAKYECNNCGRVDIFP